MRLVISLIFLILILPNLSSLIINEIEINPAEGASGKEWIELYNNGEELDVSGYTLYDGLATPKKRYTIPNNTILEQGGYLVIEFSSAKILNNDGDFVILYSSDATKIDEIPQLKETTASAKTWQLCDEWIFADSTRGEENNCETQEIHNENNKPLEDNVSASVKKESPTNKEINPEINKPIPLSANSSEEKKITKEKIEAKNIKSEKNTESLDKTNYTKYGLIGFCILLLVLFLIKKRTQKTEFEK